MFAIFLRHRLTYLTCLALSLGTLPASCAEDVTPEGPPATALASTPLIAAANQLLLWPEMVVPYELHSSVDWSKQKSFEAAMDWWKEVGFVFVPYDSTKHQEWVRFRGDYGLKSQVGRQGAGNPTDCGIESTSAAGHAAHELGHALGLKHEHIRHSPINRDSHIVIDWEAIMDGYEHNFTKLGTSWDAACSAENQSCIKGSPVAGYELGDYDTGSIMHYGSHDFGEVTAGSVIGGAAKCLLGGGLLFKGDCWSKVAYTKEVFRKVGGGKVYANRSHLSALDKSKMKELYQLYAYGCGVQDTVTPISLAAASGTVLRKKVRGCRAEELVRQQTDYTALKVTVLPKSRKTLPAGEFSVKLVTPAPGGGSSTVLGVNPGGDQTRLVLSTTTALLPGTQKVVFENLTTGFLDYELTWAFTDAVLPKDVFDAAGQGNSVTAPANLGGVYYAPLLGGLHVSGLTLHTPDDVDYFQVTLPAKKKGLDGLCGVPGAKGPNGRAVIPGSLSIKVDRQDPGRTIRTVVYKTDAAGKPIGHAQSANDTLRPWGWGTLGKTIACPHGVFGSKPVVFSFQDCSAGASPDGGCQPVKRHFYAFTVAYVETTEWADPDLLWQMNQQLKTVLQVLPKPGPKGMLVGMNAEWLANQGSQVISVLGELLGEDVSELEELANQGIFIEPGALTRAYDILASFDGEPELLEDPGFLMGYLAMRTEQMRVAEMETIERLEAGVPMLPLKDLFVVDALPAQKKKAGVIELKVVENAPTFAPVATTLHGERAAAAGAGEVGRAWFITEEGLVPVSYELVDGVAVAGGDIVLNLDETISEEEALLLLEAGL